MSLLSIIQKTCARSSITDVPTTVIGNTDSTIVQLLELCREECEELAARHEWARIQREATFNTLAAEYQGDLTTIAPDFDRFIDDTQWNRAFTQPIGCPISPANWQFLKARLATSVSYGMRIKQNPSTLNLGIYLLPIPPAGDAVYFEYVSNYIHKTIGNVAIADWQADTDSSLLPEKLISQGLRWRWKKEKGLSYGEDFATYERNVAVTWASDGGGAPTLGMDAGAGDGMHYVDFSNVPDGNW